MKTYGLSISVHGNQGLGVLFLFPSRFDIYPDTLPSDLVATEVKTLKEVKYFRHTGSYSKSDIVLQTLRKGFTLLANQPETVRVVIELNSRVVANWLITGRIPKKYTEPYAKLIHAWNRAPVFCTVTYTHKPIVDRNSLQQCRPTIDEELTTL